MYNLFGKPPCRRYEAVILTIFWTPINLVYSCSQSCFRRNSVFLSKKKCKFVYPRSTKELTRTRSKMPVFEERGKPEYPEKNLSEKNREPTTNSTHIYTLFQNGHYFSGLLFAFKLALVASFLNSKFKRIFSLERGNKG